MKTHRFKQLYLYWSGGKRNVKCVRFTLEMKASKEEQRGVVRLLVAEGAGTREIHRSMSAVYGEHCMSVTNVLLQNLIHFEHFEICILKLIKNLISRKLVDQLN